MPARFDASLARLTHLPSCKAGAAGDKPSGPFRPLQDALGRPASDGDTVAIDEGREHKARTRREH
jgi:hypothetical protein